MTLNSRMTGSFILSALALLLTSSVFASTGALQAIKMFDGTIAACQEGADVGDRAWRPLSQSGVINGDTLTISMTFETLRCDNVGGKFMFSQVAMGTRAVNANGGFNEYTALDMVGYTPNRKVNLTVAVDPRLAVQTVTFTTSTNLISGLTPRNARRGGRSATLVTYLSGDARVGSSVTGEYHPRVWRWDFGAFGIFVSESQKSLRTAR